MMHCGAATMQKWTAVSSDSKERSPIISPVGRMTTYRPGLDDMPAELVVEIVRADPETVLPLLDTSRRYAEIVLEGVLFALRIQLSERGKDTRSYVKGCLRAGRTPAAIVFFSDALSSRNLSRRLQWAETFRIIPPRVRQSLCQPLLQFLCAEAPLIEAFGMRQPAIALECEVACSYRMVGRNLPAELGREIWSIDGKAVTLTGLDRVLLPFAAALGPNRFFEFCREQYRLADAVRWDFGHIRIPQWERRIVAAADIRNVGHGLLRYLSAEQVGRLGDCNPRKNEVAVDGIFYPIVAGQPVVLRVVDVGKPDLSYSDVEANRKRQQELMAKDLREMVGVDRRQCCVIS